MRRQLTVPKNTHIDINFIRDVNKPELARHFKHALPKPSITPHCVTCISLKVRKNIKFKKAHGRLN